ncbi:hypothetical protein FRX31_029800 [Thalictrum thalictroides]|uniref:Uncharacterized protein n=1 Tax=Thalictrum thalictroides TaxID=46969 RepID=A0A7J6V679_THATH|nr:hypothetical protein FRX31_029800 [Thalictrum thalictroides]
MKTLPVRDDKRDHHTFLSVLSDCERRANDTAMKAVRAECACCNKSRTLHTHALEHCRHVILQRRVMGVCVL